MDDVGAATKWYEIRAENDLHIGPLRISGNLLFLKAIPPFRRWGPYRELRPRDWEQIYTLLAEYNAVMTVGVTAAWVNWDGTLTPFNQRFPGEADILRAGVKDGRIEIANHGLTHCVLKNHAFRPSLRYSNRKAHREFVETVELATQEEHIRRSQELLQEIFDIEVITFVPPGNAFTEATLDLAARYGLKVVSCNAPPREHPQLAVIGNENVVAFHDREIVLEGLNWLKLTLESHREHSFRFVRDLALVTADQLLDR
jgi:peptidoglycan/xylan/chitin deacetylase (PgdA/CDA1 family)